MDNDHEDDDKDNDDRDDGWFRHHHRHHHRKLETIRFTNTLTGEFLMDTSLNTTQKILVTANPLDPAGATVAWPAAVVWATSDEAVASVTPSADTYSAEIVSGTAGVTTVTAYTTRTDGVVITSEPLSVTVTAAPLASITLTVGTPEVK